MDNDWIIFGIPFVMALVGTVMVVGSLRYELSMAVTVSGLGIILVGVLILAGGIHRLPEPDDAEETH